MDLIDVGASIDKLGETALAIKAERDALRHQLEACEIVLRHNTTETFKQLRMLRQANEALRAEVAALKAAAGVNL